MMPEMDGPATCARLKADPATADIPVIFVTAKSQAAEVEAGKAAGAAGYLLKPFDVVRIGDDITRILDGLP
jgi:CheY-like chemotaxis protein